jgi:hypothetical protein
MSVVRFNFLPEFYLDDDAVLTLDGGGAGKMKDSAEKARNNRSSRFLHNGVAQEFYIDPGAATVDLSPTRVVWRLDHAKAAEISEDLVALRTPRDSGRTAVDFYVDIASPAETLVISRDDAVVDPVQFADANQRRRLRTTAAPSPRTSARPSSTPGSTRSSSRPHSPAWPSA